MTEKSMTTKETSEVTVENVNKESPEDAGSQVPKSIPNQITGESVPDQVGELDPVTEPDRVANQLKKETLSTIELEEELTKAKSAADLEKIVKMVQDAASASSSDAQIGATGQQKSLQEHLAAKLATKDKKKSRKKADMKPYQGPVTLYPFLEVTQVALAWSRYFHQQSHTPTFVLTGTQRHNRVWEVMDMLGKPVGMKNFFRGRIPDLYKRAWFFKAERANQDLMMSQVFANFCWQLTTRHANPLHYQSRPVTGVFLQWVKIYGHKVVVQSFFEADPGQPLVKPVKEMCLVGIEVNGVGATPPERYYFDFTSHQVDVYSWMNHPDEPETSQNKPTSNHYYRNKRGYPLLIIPCERLIEGTLYAPELSSEVRIAGLEEPLYVDSDQAYQEYLKVVEQKNLEDDSDFDLIEYHQKMYRGFRDTVNKPLASMKKKNRKKAKKTADRAQVQHK